MRAGDMVIFDSGRHVHRVTPVEGIDPRYTLGGFLTVDHQSTEIANWSKQFFIGTDCRVQLGALRRSTRA